MGMTNFLVKFSVSGLFVAIYFMVTHEGEGIPTIPLFFVFLFVVILLNKVPSLLRQRVTQKLQEKQPPVTPKQSHKRASKKDK